MPNPSPLRCLHLLRSLATLMFTATVLAEPPPSAPTPRDHHLFVGAELQVRIDGTLFPVRHADEARVLIQDPLPRYHPLGASDGFSHRLVTKISSAFAHIDRLTTRAIHYAPLENIAAHARLQVFLADQSDVISEQQRSLLAGAAQAAEIARQTTSPDIQQQAAAAETNLINEAGFVASDLAKLESLQNSAATESDLFTGNGPGLQNTLKLSFDLSAPQEITGAYLFIQVRVRADGEWRDISFCRSIDRVFNKPRRVSILQPGFPPGFEVADTQLHLFRHGVEIPTTLSPKHMAITQADAREFARLQRLGDTTQGTAPAVVVPELLPLPLLDATRADALDVPVLVSLDARGEIISLGDARQIVPAPVDAALRAMTFLPALENGQAVPSTLTVNPGEFAGLTTPR